jgi:hypothetical protein
MEQLVVGLQVRFGTTGDDLTHHKPFEAVVPSLVEEG